MNIKRAAENLAIFGGGAYLGLEFANRFIAPQIGHLPPEQQLVQVGLYVLGGSVVVGGGVRIGIDELRAPAPPPKVRPKVGKTMGEIDQPLSSSHGDVIVSSYKSAQGRITIDTKTGKRK